MQITLSGVTVDMISARDAFETIIEWRSAGRRKYVVFTNPHSVMTCQRDPAMRESTLGAALVLPDGVGLALAARLLGYKASRVTGPSFMLNACDWGRRENLRHFLLGGTEDVVRSLRRNLEGAYPGLRIAGTCAPPFRQLSEEEEDRAIVARINASEPDVVWIGLGAPKQEKWMSAHVGQIHASSLIGVGAAFDFHATPQRWAPPLVRKAGLEWLYRLAREPRRLWRRNLDSPAFLASVVMQALWPAPLARPTKH